MVDKVVGQKRRWKEGHVRWLVAGCMLQDSRQSCLIPYLTRTLNELGGSLSCLLCSMHGVMFVVQSNG